MKKFYEYVETFIFPVLVVAFILTFVFRIVTVSGESMENTLHNGEKVVVTHLYKNLERGDVIVTDSENKSAKPLVKRVIGIRGDTVKIDYESATVYVNGEPLDELYIKETMSSNIGQYLELKVPEGCIYIMGDNRNNSGDSRSIGPVDEKCVLGKVIFRVMPLSRIGKIK